MGAQFGRLEIYSRKKDSKGRNTAFIFAEARRDPAASLHVSVPEDPKVIYGKSIKEIEALHNEAAEKARITIKGGRKRRLRQDQNTLVAIVISHPYKTEDIKSNEGMQKELHKFERHIRNWLQRKYGSDLMSIVRHMDERYYHLHVFIVPLSDPELKASHYHPGIMAKETVMTKGKREGTDNKLLRRKGDKAYRDAMREWQDELFREVSQFSGLTRFGPRRQRLSKDEWYTQQAQAKIVQQANDALVVREAQLQTNITNERPVEDGVYNNRSAVVSQTPNDSVSDGRSGYADGHGTDEVSDPLESFAGIDTSANSTRVSTGLKHYQTPAMRRAGRVTTQSSVFGDSNSIKLSANDLGYAEMQRKVRELTRKNEALLEEVRILRAKNPDPHDEMLDNPWARGLQAEPEAPSLHSGR